MAREYTRLRALNWLDQSCLPSQRSHQRILLSLESSWPACSAIWIASWCRWHRLRTEKKYDSQKPSLMAVFSWQLLTGGGRGFLPLSGSASNCVILRSLVLTTGIVIELNIFNSRYLMVKTNNNQTSWIIETANDLEWHRSGGHYSERRHDSLVHTINRDRAPEYIDKTEVHIYLLVGSVQDVSCEPVRTFTGQTNFYQWCVTGVQFGLLYCDFWCEGVFLGVVDHGSCGYFLFVRIIGQCTLTRQKY